MRRNSVFETMAGLLNGGDGVTSADPKNSDRPVLIDPAVSPSKPLCGIGRLLCGITLKFLEVGTFGTNFNLN